METNTCGKCRKDLPTSEFNLDRARKTGYAWQCKACRKEYDQGYHSDNREKHLETMRKNAYARRYKMTVAEYDGLFKAQDSACAICGASEGWQGKRLAVDHDHKSGAIRGLLCDRCNTVLGKMEDSPELLRRAASYLE
jgi:hypothetical protein